jgi:hypothetical protein
VSATLWQVAAKTLDAYCATRVDSTTRVQTLTSYATGGTMTLANAASFLAVSGNANFSGDLLQMDKGAIQVDGPATFGGGRVLVTGGGITLRSSAQFSSTSASYDTAKVLIEGDVTFAGTGVQKFNSGSLTLHGNFAQNDVGNGNFDASADHTTIFSGAKTQSISFADPNSSHFGRLEVDNPLGVAFLTSSNQPLSTPTARSIILLPSGVMSVNNGAAVSLAGLIDLRTGSKLTVDGSLSVTSCQGGSIATIGGVGAINGVLPSLFICLP